MYKDLEIELERMLELKTATVPLVMGALGTIKKEMESHTNKLLRYINLHDEVLILRHQRLKALSNN